MFLEFQKYVQTCEQWRHMQNTQCRIELGNDYISMYLQFWPLVERDFGGITKNSSHCLDLLHSHGMLPIFKILIPYLVLSNIELCVFGDELIWQTLLHKSHIRSRNQLQGQVWWTTCLGLVWWVKAIAHNIKTLFSEHGTKEHW